MRDCGQMNEQMRNMMNDNINNTLHNLVEVYNKCVTHHKEINKRYGKDK